MTITRTLGKTIAAALLTLACTTTTSATVDLGDGLTVWSSGSDDGSSNQVFVARDGLAVELEPELDWPDIVIDARVRPTPDKSGVDVTFWLNCSGTARARFTRDALRATVEHAAGRYAKDAAAALPRHERAVALAPDEPIYRVALMRALVKLDRKDDAVTVMAATPSRAQLVVSYLVRRDATLAALADAPPTRAWRTGSGSRALPAYDPVRRLIVVDDWTGNAMAEGGGGRMVSVLDADTSKRVFVGPVDPLWSTLAGELGFEAPLEYRPPIRGGGSSLAIDGMTLVSGRATKVFANRKLIGSVKRGLWDEYGERGAAVFEDRVLGIGSYNIGDGCGAHLGAYFTVMPLTAPGPVWHQALAAATRARRALAAGRVDDAMGSLDGPAIRREPVVVALRAIADARAGRVTEARAALTTLPEPYASLAAHDPLAPEALVSAPGTRVGDAVSLPAYDPIGRVMVLPDPRRPDGVTFITDAGATRVAGLEVTAAFLAARGFMAPLSATTATGASQGDWRAVHAGPPELRIACGESRLSFVRAGERVGGGPCYGPARPEVVWFFDGAVAYRGDEPSLDGSGDVESVVRAVLARP